MKRVRSPVGVVLWPRWPGAGSCEQPAQFRFGSFAASMTRCTSGRATYSSRVEWIAPSGVESIRFTIAAVLNVGSFGAPCVM